MMFSRWITGLLLAMSSGMAAAAGGYADLDHAEINVFDQASLQRGAAMFMNYCAGCHSAQFMRYQRLIEDIGLTEEEVLENLAFGDQEPGDYIMAAMSSSDAAEWFGAAPPDLSLTARAKGPDWIYTFLRSYYMTEDGWNNTVLANASMPHVLWELQGIQRPVTESHEVNGETQTKITGFEIDEPGLLSPAEYDSVILDLVTFLEYVAEPAILKRERLGIWVLLFLAVFTFVSYIMYKEYWKDVKK
ncbi:MAG: cytochrome c1 [Wenzhouxiangella sp.]|jgi:ubiquinol-cytochrome c reductase cytochrome c1 subunit|nr:cytochrome c1 [Wenzhouxiangella sp.]